MTNKHISIRQRILWWIAGVDVNIIQECPASEKNKHAGIGATILITAFIAAISGTYAAFTVANNWLVAVALGLFWGGTIMTIDKLMVSTLKKSKDDKFQEIFFAIPRALLALGIAFVISKPIEVKVLENQIERYIQHTVSKEQSIVNDGFERNLGIASISKELADIDRKINRIRSDKQGVKNEGIYIQLEQVESECKTNVSNWNRQIERYRNEINNIQAFTYPKYKAEVKGYKITEGPNSGQRVAQLPVGEIGNEIQFLVITEDGKRRISQLEGYIRGLKNSINTSNCSEFKENKNTYYFDRQKDLNNQERNLWRLEEKKDSLLQAQQEKLDSISEVNRTVLLAASKGFIGKLFALEKGKRENEIFPTELDTIVKSAPIKKINPATEAFPNVIAIRYNIDLGTINYEGDTLQVPEIENTKEVLLNYYIEKPNEESQIKIASFGGNKNLLWWVSNALFVFFLMIELLPIMVKVMAPYGVYDKLIKRQAKKMYSKFKGSN